jgi:hypothetical protein
MAIEFEIILLVVGINDGLRDFGFFWIASHMALQYFPNVLSMMAHATNPSYSNIKNIEREVIF